MNIDITALQSLLSMLTLEGLKQLVYLVAPDFNFDVKWYTVILPALGLLVLPVASYLAGGAFDFSVWTNDAVRQTLLLMVTALGAMFGYNTALKPFKMAVATYNLKRQGK